VNIERPREFGSTLSVGCLSHLAGMEIHSFPFSKIPGNQSKNRWIGVPVHILQIGGYQQGAVQNSGHPMVPEAAEHAKLYVCTMYFSNPCIHRIKFNL
jgi:hypothetical protein